jgi:hypothetical protein
MMEKLLEILAGETEVLEESLTHCRFVDHKPQMLPGREPGRRGKPATNYLSYGAALCTGNFTILTSWIKLFSLVILLSLIISLQNIFFVFLKCVYYYNNIFSPFCVVENLYSQFHRRRVLFVFFTKRKSDGYLIPPY